MYIFLTFEFALGLLIGLALRASSTERAQLRHWNDSSRDPRPSERWGVRAAYAPRRGATLLADD
jgi:hypothetical protein